MRTLQHYLLNTFVLCFLFCCNLFAQVEKLYINPATASPAKQSKFIEFIRFIPITSPVKISHNASLIMIGKYQIICDYNDKKLFFLDDHGKYIKSINLKKYGNASIEYDHKNDLLKFNIRNKNYTLLDKDLAEIRSDFANKRNQKYFRNYVIDLNDENLQFKRTATDPYFIINANWYYDDYYYQTDLNINSKDSLGYELSLLQHFKPVKGFFSFNKAADNLFKYTYKTSEINLSESDTNYVKYFSRSFQTGIYRLFKDSIEQLYEIILPAENAFPQNILRNGFKSKSDWEYFRSNNGAIFSSLEDIRNTKNYLLFGIEYFRGFKSILYDKRDGRYYNLDKIKADSTQFNIHLLQNGLGYTVNDKFYSLVPANAIVDFYLKNKNLSYPPELQKWLKTASKDSNPVLIEYKFKD